MTYVVDAHTEKLARLIAHYHGSKMIVGNETLAARRGYGSFGHSSENYADNHWKEYVQAAEAVRDMIIEDCCSVLRAAHNV
jgi:hypothetical protein